MTEAACVRCGRRLLFELDADLAEAVRVYINSLPEDARVNDEVYGNRLRICRSCEHLVNGMCALCGCFVEVRAAKKLSRCAKSGKVW